MPISSLSFLIRGFPHLGFFPNTMTAALIFLILSISVIPSHTHMQSNEQGFISVVISEKGLVFVKDLLIKQALSSLTPLHLPKIQKSVKIPFVGGVHVVLSNITIYQIEVSSSSIQPGDSGVAIVASGATANLSMAWNYSYSTWLIPIDISDKGRASVQVEGMEVGLTIGMNVQEGTLKLNLMECGCYLKDIFITLDGGASWFYQGLVDAFEGQIRSAVEKAITGKIKQGILKLDTFLQSLPKQIPVDDIAALNVTFVNDPLLHNSSLEFEINGLFTSEYQAGVPIYYLENSHPSTFCKGPLKMLGTSLDEAVFNSASNIYFKAGLMHWIVDKVSDQYQYLLNTAGWRYIVPQLYKNYPNDDVKLNISLSSPPTVRITSDSIGATIFSDMTIDVLEGNEIIPVACISVVTRASGFLEISGNNLAGQARLNDFTLKLKWSKIGNFHMYLIEVMQVFLKDVCIPYLNSRLRKGFPLPIIHGFTVQNADILFTDSKVVVCSDVAFTDSDSISEASKLLIH
ncbi:lipid-binding serum glycoprotein family protein isoform X2 [Tasmannia lanceolata]|uniref:lipid-binding serum glycoprotein family protein isoform X2 n=1 Tax=Tasmannia lanceolata TaxID=3420 RepID=UPI0040648DE0